jgi:hypothetical protein
VAWVVPFTYPPQPVQPHTTIRQSNNSSDDKDRPLQYTVCKTCCRDRETRSPDVVSEYLPCQVRRRHGSRKDDNDIDRPVDIKDIPIGQVRKGNADIQTYGKAPEKRGRGLPQGPPLKGNDVSVRNSQ